MFGLLGSFLDLCTSAAITPKLLLSAPHLAAVKKFHTTLDTTCTRLLGLADTMSAFTDNKEIVEKGRIINKIRCFS